MKTANITTSIASILAFSSPAQAGTVYCTNCSTVYTQAMDRVTNLEQLSTALDQYTQEISQTEQQIRMVQQNIERYQNMLQNTKGMIKAAHHMRQIPDRHVRQQDFYAARSTPWRVK